jgi:RimJ/RimL family protein N-acetyltransferase
MGPDTRRAAPGAGSAPLPLTEQLRRWRLEGDLDAARRLLEALLAQRPADRGLQRLTLEHQSFWWQPLTGPRVQLTRRAPADLPFLRACWADRDFMTRFHRQAPPLPASDDEAGSLLQRECAAIPSESRALHWTLRTAVGPIGLLSVVDLNAAHRRGEFLIGLRGPRGAWAGVEAAHLAFDFLARRAGLERLTAYFYPDNRLAQRSALKLGFEHEGVLRGYLRSADGQRHDLQVAGLLLDEAFFQRTAALRRRVFGPGAASGIDTDPDSRRAR